MRPWTKPAKGWLLRDLPDSPAGVPGGEHAVRDVPRDHAPGPDDRLRADLHAGAEDRPAADPHIGTDLDGPGELLPPAQVGVHRVRGGVELDRRAEQREVSDLHQAHVEDHAVEVEEDPLAQQDVRAVVAEERRLHPDRLPALAEEGREDAAAGLLVPFTGRIQVLAQVPGPFPGLDEFRGERVVQFSGQHLLLLSAHWTSRSLWIVNGPAAESLSRTSALPPTACRSLPSWAAQRSWHLQAEAPRPRRTSFPA